MGALTHPRTGKIHALAARSLVGRSPLALHRLDDRMVSNEHAVIYFEEGSWWVKDLGSRNGTWVDDQRATPHHAIAVIRGARIAFGTPHAFWSLSDAGPPSAFAMRVSDDHAVVAEEGLLMIPSAENPRLAAFSDGMGGWMVERDGEVVNARKINEVALDDEVWRLVLPFENQATWGSNVDLTLAPKAIFHVSSDEEHVEIELIRGADTKRLEPRAHAYFLLLLARQRAEDASQGVSPIEQGWLHTEDVCRMLRMDRATVNQRVFRARQHLAKTGMITAADVIERRAHTGQMRIGLNEVQERPLT